VGKKTNTTDNFELADALRGHTKDILFLSATPHQGNSFQFWSLIQLLNDQLFPAPEAMERHRQLLSRVMIRRTRREVTDAEGLPIFRRRQVLTQPFKLSPREMHFYEQLSDYLREGYSAAGVGQKRTTSQQRAIGFVMTTFQKIMSSSPRAIRQALRRRLFVLLMRKTLESEERRRRSDFRAGETDSPLAEKIMKLQDEMRTLAGDILGEGSNQPQESEIEAYVGRVRRKLLKKLEDSEESTSWSLEGDEESEEGVYAEADIPDEINKVRELIRLVPSGTDRRFETLVRAISDLLRQSPRERFVIFTQYRETLEFLKDELGKIFGTSKITDIKGAPLDEKIAAVEEFWKEDGAQFLISTSAGGEGINLQIASILFNYDLPWNPMAIEQRIGRIHRYGQRETVQVYNLVAEDTVEEKIYDIVQRKLADIARTIGKLDEQGNPSEDFESDILGFLGSRPDYQELFKRALMDKDYRRTEEEIQKMIEDARRAHEALEELAQDLSGFNLEHFRRLEGRYTLPELGEWAQAAILKFGGSAIPAGEFIT